jgi:hypothetical protein
MRTPSRIPRGMNTRMVTLLAPLVTHTRQCPMAIRQVMDLLNQCQVLHQSQIVLTHAAKG